MRKLHSSPGRRNNLSIFRFNPPRERAGERLKPFPLGRKIKLPPVDQGGREEGRRISEVTTLRSRLRKTKKLLRKVAGLVGLILWATRTSYCRSVDPRRVRASAPRERGDREERTCAETIPWPEPSSRCFPGIQGFSGLARTRWHRDPSRRETELGSSLSLSL